MEKEMNLAMIEDLIDLKNNYSAGSSNTWKK